MDSNTSKIKTIFIAIAFGTSVRDVLRNDTFKKLKKRKDIKIVILAPHVKDHRFIEEFSSPNVAFEPLVNFNPSFAEKILFHFHKACLRDKCKTIDLGNTSANTITLDIFTPFARLAIKALGDEKVLKLIHWSYRNFTKATLYQNLFDKYQPDLAVVTRVLSYSMDYPILRMAAENKVPVVSCISSWDNLTSKGFFPFSLKSLVVWNEIIAEEAKDLFFFPSEDIFISGIPRYDLYFQKKDFKNRKDTFERYGLDPTRKMILYGTGSRHTGPTKIDPTTPEPDIVEYIADMIDEGKIDSSTQLLVRLHPQADINHYKNLEGRANVKVHAPGRDVELHDRLFSQQDDKEYAETLMHSDLVINFASTVSIDAAVFDRPIICVNFDFKGKRPYKYSLTRIYAFDHYRKLIELGGIRLPESKGALIQDINNYLDNPALDKEGRKNIVDKQCHFSDGKSGERIANHILQILSKETEIEKVEVDLDVMSKLS